MVEWFKVAIAIIQCAATLVLAVSVMTLAMQVPNREEIEQEPEDREPVESANSQGNI